MTTWLRKSASSLFGVFIHGEVVAVLLIAGLLWLIAFATMPK